MGLRGKDPIPGLARSTQALEARGRPACSPHRSRAPVGGCGPLYAGGFGCRAVAWPTALADRCAGCCPAGHQPVQCPGRKQGPSTPEAHLPTGWTGPTAAVGFLTSTWQLSARNLAGTDHHSGSMHLPETLRPQPGHPGPAGQSRQRGSGLAAGTGHREPRAALRLRKGAEP